MSKGIVRTWTFRSESNPNKAYETILYDDGTLSCNCPGWTQRCQGGFRTCKHVRMAEAGTADRYAEAVWNAQDRNKLQERTRQAEKVVERQTAERLNRTRQTGTRIYRDDREQQVRGAEFESLVKETQDETNKRKLARIAERLKKETSTEGMDIFPTKRKVNWQ